MQNPPPQLQMVQQPATSQPAPFCGVPGTELAAMAQAAWGQMEGSAPPPAHPGAMPEQPSISLSAQAELELDGAQQRASAQAKLAELDARRREREAEAAAERAQREAEWREERERARQSETRADDRYERNWRAAPTVGGLPPPRPRPTAGADGSQSVLATPGVWRRPEAAPAMGKGD